jgi:hypothetical protein
MSDYCNKRFRKSMEKTGFVLPKKSTHMEERVYMNDKNQGFLIYNIFIVMYGFGYTAKSLSIIDVCLLLLLLLARIPFFMVNHNLVFDFVGDSKYRPFRPFITIFHWIVQLIIVGYCLQWLNFYSFGQVSALLIPSLLTKIVKKENEWTNIFGWPFFFVCYNFFIVFTFIVMLSHE